ncbi:MAG: DEAD/DEAH box helicase [Chitinophagaceae bacterium]
MSDTRNTKTYLFFQPKNLLSRKPVFVIQQWIKTPNGLETGEQPLTRPQLKKFFPSFSDDTISALLFFSPVEMIKTEKELLNNINYISNEEERIAARKKAIARHQQSIIGRLRWQTSLVMYHSATSNGTAVQTTRCGFFNYSPELICDIKGDAGAYKLNIFVVHGKERVPLQNYQRFHFLLYTGNQYYLLPVKFYEAIEWLELQYSSQWVVDNSSSLEMLIEKLNAWGVKTNVEQLTAGEEIVVIPQPQVLLSELNDTFLKIEPRFIYDGYVIDGPFEKKSKLQSGNKTIQIARNKEKEEELTTVLRSLHEKFSNQNNGFFYLTFAEAQKKNWFLKVYHRLLEMDIDLIGIDFMKHFRYSSYKAETSLSNQEIKGNWIYIDLSVKFGKENVPLSNLQKCLLNGQRAVMLKDGSLGVLGDEWLQQYGMMIRHSKIHNQQLQVPKWLLLSETENEESTTTKVKTGITNNWLEKWKQRQTKEEILYSLPSGLSVNNLRPYQQKGYEWLRLLAEIGGSGCLADDMGLGKTLQTITFLLHTIEENPNGKNLVVAPASLLYNWQQELEKFAPSVSSDVFHGAGRDKSILTDTETKIIITSYGTLRQDIEVLQTISWSVVVIDESHYIKNPSAQTTKAAWQLSAKTKIALTGTPIMNGTGDLYSQMHFLLPGLLGSNEFFRREYAVPIEQNRDEVKSAALQKIIQPFILRRTKEQAAPDLPAKTESVLWCEMDTDQRAAYESIKESVRSNVLTEINENGLNKGKLSVLAGLLKLRQTCNSCELVKDEDLFTYDSIKTKVLIDELTNIIPQHRALVFSQFTSMLDLLERDLQKNNINTIRLDGQTQVSKRQELVAQFQQDESIVSVFLISLKAGNAGLNLTKADYVFLFDPWWNTAVENQAIDRTHRIGQLEHVFAYRMICKDSIEEKILKMAAGKKKLAEDIISTDESFLKNLTMDDIRYLLE